MWISSNTRKWMMVFTGGVLLLSLLLSFHDSVVVLETLFYEQLIALTPSFLNLPPTDPSFPVVVQQTVTLCAFSIILLCLKLTSCSSKSVVFIIPFISSLFMLQVLLGVMQQIWFPVVWPMLTFCLNILVLYLWLRFPQIKNLVLPESVCQTATIKQYIEQQDYRTAVLILKNCPFSDDMFELAYDLGIQLEQQRDWALARNLYVWLVQFDPGMQDFVERIDSMRKPKLDEDITVTQVTEQKAMFGDYHLLGKKARGATATVYEAHDMNTHKRIALKILNQKLSDDTGSRDIMTFLHEALTASQLDHPNIVKIHDADIIQNQAFIAMDYISGHPMSERLRRKKLITAIESLRIMRSVLDALIAAHEKGIVHGDIKPANIMYDRKLRQFIITDFGAAYSDFLDIDNGKKITGTPAYMSPEQLSGNRIDGRSDLFSLAVTIYHLLSGQQPFSGEKLSEMKHNVVNQQVELDSLTIPDCIKSILLKALAKKPYQRFADASQMLQAVTHCEKKLSKSN